MESKTFKLKCCLLVKAFMLLIFFISKGKDVEILMNQKAVLTTSFIIIGTYQEERNALKHLRQARLYIKSAGYFFNDMKNSFYVYAYKSHDKHATLKKLHELRSNPYFKEAWYYKHQPEKSIAVESFKDHLIPLAQSSAKEPASQKVHSNQPPTVKNQLKIEEKYSTKLAKRSPEVGATEPSFGQVEGRLKAGSRIHTIAPVNTSVAKQNAIDQLQTAKSGDIIIFNNLLFHPNAAILQHSSESDLNKLLSIMLDNSRMKIRIHGHTNGDFRGEIITMGKKDKNYFRANSKNDYLQGDAVLLSVERAKIISRYLKEKGILPERMEIKGWGGEKTIYPLNSVKSSLNSRVEIEILEK